MPGPFTCTTIVPRPNTACRGLPSTDLLGRLVWCASREDTPQNEGRTGSGPAQDDLRNIRRVLDGNGDAFRLLIQRYQGRVSQLMWRFSRDADTHEDLVQDVFIEAFRSLPGYKAQAPFEHWLSRIAVRVGYRHWKRERSALRDDTVSLEEWNPRALAAPEELSPSEAGQTLFDLLRMLPARDRLVLTLRYVEGHSVERTAQLTGWSQPMVKVQALRARAKLRRLFDQLGKEAGP